MERKKEVRRATGFSVEKIELGWRASTRSFASITILPSGKLRFEKRGEIAYAHNRVGRMLD